VLDQLAMLAIGAPLSDDELTRLDAAARRGDLTAEGFIDLLLRRPEFARDVAPQMLLLNIPRGSHVQYPQYTLKAFKSGEREILYLRAPCKPEEAEVVHPWWKLSSSVLVCPEAHRPGVLQDGELYCGMVHLGTNAIPEKCGCGPNLMECARDDAHRAAIAESARKEMQRTVEYIVEHGLPLEDLYTANETFRDRNVEALYNRGRVSTKLIPAMPDEAWPEEGKYARRPEAYPGQHAGILTSMTLVWGSDGIRMRQSYFDQLLYCTGSTSVDVKTDVLLGLGVRSVRDGEGWQQLAGMPGCTLCHARLDYGMQFFRGYNGLSRGANFFLPPLPTPANGRIYFRDIHDFRAEAPLSPHSFASIAVKQPEWAACMVDRVAKHVFHDQLSFEDRQVVQASFDQTHRLVPAMRAALLRYASRLGERPQPVATHALAGASRPANHGEVAVSPTLRRLFDQHCVACHDEGPRDLRPATLARETFVRALSQVAWGKMPKTRSGLPADARAAFVGELVATLWDEGPARAEAMRYWMGGLHPFSAYHPTAIGRAIHAKGGAAREAGTLAPESLIESYVAEEDVDYGPGLAAFTALNALGECKAAGLKGDALASCLARASAKNVVTDGR
jgi:hypothetical protein